MERPRPGPETTQDSFDLTLCCPEAQCDGVPCPTLGRSCEVCERARRAEGTPPPSIDWPEQRR